MMYLLGIKAPNGAVQLECDSLKEATELAIEIEKTTHTILEFSIKPYIRTVKRETVQEFVSTKIIGGKTI